MATIYHYDLYPRTDPRDGDRLVRFSSLQKATYRDVMGVGSGVGILRSTHADAAFLDPLGEQYVRVVEETDAVEAVVGGFWLSDNKHQTAVRRETKRLTMAGPGIMAYLARASMAPHTYLDTAIGQDPYDDIWRLWAQGPIAGGDHLGAVLWRAVYEAQHFRVALTEHRHKDGLIYTDSHADSDRTATAIPDVVLGFDAFDDSDGNAWTLPSGEFTARVGENLLSVVQRLMQAGLYVEMDPDTFELRAWEGRPASRGGRSTDRTGSAWGASVVRFQSPTDGTIETGNIKSDTESRFKSFLRRTLVWAGGGDVYAKAAGASDVLWEGFEGANLQDVSALQQLASTQVTAREEAADAVDPKMKLGDDPEAGKYRPWQEVRIDELVTVHTGSGQWDFDERTFPVAGLRIELQKGGDWAAYAELGASFEAGRERRFEVAPIGAHSHGPNPELCRIGHSGSDSFTRLYFSSATSALNSTPPAAGAAWDNVGDTTVRQLLTTADTSYGATGGPTSSAGDTGGGSPVDVRMGRFAIELTVDMAATLAAGGAVLRIQARTRSRSGTGISEAAQDNISQVRAYVTTGASSTVRGVALEAHGLISSAGSAKWPAQSTLVNRILPAAAADDVLTAVSGAAAGDYLVLEIGYRSFTDDTTGGRMYLTNNAASDLPEDETTTTALNSWVQLSVSGTGATTGDLPLDTVRQGEEQTGTSIRAARCDHQHAHGLLSTDGAHYHNREDIEGSVELTLDELSDVEAPTPSDGDVLVWDDTEGFWVPAAPGSGMSNPMTTRGDLIRGAASPAGDPERFAVGTAGYVLAARTDPTWEAQRVTLNFLIDGGGSAIATGAKGDVVIDFDCVIESVTLLADQSGSIVVDLWKDTYANFPPTVADTITASAKPTLSSAAKSQDTTLTGWTTAITAGQTLRVNVDSAATVTRVTLALKLRRT